MVNYKLKGYMLDALDNQIKDNDPKCVNETLEKLINMGYKEDRSREMVAAVLLEEIYDVLKSQEPFNEERYSNRLAMLPEYSSEPIEEELEDDFEDELIQIPIRNGNKIERNEPCPCGSGKKYKKCCGKNI